MKKLTAIILILAITFGVVIPARQQDAEAATVYIKVKDFAKSLVKELGLTELKGKESSGYVNRLIDISVIKDGDFSNYNSYLTRGDCLMLLSRADDYYNAPQIDGALVNMVIEKRISDIKKATASKREDIARGFIKGFMKGYSNGNYITNRNLKLKNKITKSGALSCIKMIKDSSKRAKISPDGQLIRTTNLPKNADKFEYILAAYPNKFYERPFEFTRYTNWKKTLTYGDDYIYPVDMRDSMYRVWDGEWPFSVEMDKYLYDWQEKAETFLQYLFNVDYRTVDDEWIEGLASCYVNSNVDMVAHINEFYIKAMKNNNVIVESKIIAVEPSMLYKDGFYCMRAYVRYRISAKDINVKQSKLIYSQYPDLKKLKSGVWRDGIFDIRFGTNNGYQGDGEEFAINLLTSFVDR